MYLHTMRDGNTITIEKILRVGPIITGDDLLTSISGRYSVREIPHFLIHFDYGQTYKVSNNNEAELMTDRDEVIDHMRTVIL